LPLPSSTMTTTIVHDTSEAVCLSADYNLYLKPIAKMTVSVALPQLKLPGKSISNWEVMERVKSMVAPELFSVLRISKSTMDYIRFEGEVENKTVVKNLLSRLDGKTIKLSGFTDVLKVRAVENKVDCPTRHDWDSFFRDAKDMNETLPGERPDTIHLEGLPCRWFSQKDSQFPDRPSEEVLIVVFETFGKIRKVDIPMLDPYREEMMDKNFSTFSFGGHLNFEAYIQFVEYGGFTKAMDTLRSMKLMLKGEDGKAVACNIKVTFDTSKHLSDGAIKKRNLERQKLQELEKQREEQKRREKEEEERKKEEERKQKEQEEEEKERRKEERLRKREQKLKEREERKNMKKVKKQQVEEQKKLQMKIAMEERRLLLAQRNLESIRLIAELLARAKQQQLEKERKEELARLKQLEACRLRQEQELRRVEVEKERALELQRREKELRDKLLCNLLKKGSDKKSPGAQEQAEEEVGGADELIMGVLSRVNGVKAETSGVVQNIEVKKVQEDKSRERNKDDPVRGRYSKEKAKVRAPPHRGSSPYNRDGRRESLSRQRRSSSRHGGRRKGLSGHGSKRKNSSRHGSSRRMRSDHSQQRGRSHSSCSSSSRDRSRSSSGGGRNYRRGRHGCSRSRSRSPSYSRHYRRHSNSRDKSHSRRR
uniref:A kinase (PRKA) anchor protein 17A n=1 Tax=Neogobius melanostomus TaxID=47308 RepID=A0A8C6T1Q2_9GOBI